MRERSLIVKQKFSPVNKTSSAKAIAFTLNTRRWSANISGQFLNAGALRMEMVMYVSIL
ncbi:MAG: hypothetical protein LBV68_08385 [Spirochaetaceae bacterium]|nr:hypothetical protein [Spirochaetaceae bacterium]